AEPVRRHACRRDRTAAADRNLAGDVASGGPFRIRASDDDVVDFGRVDRRAPHRLAEDMAAHGGAMSHVERAAPAFAERRARGGHDNGIWHTQPFYNLPMPMALDDVVVLDLSHALAGPFTSTMLADYGATVIKIEPPEGEMARGWGPPFYGSESAYFVNLNRNKQSVAIDLKHPEGR